MDVAAVAAMLSAGSCGYATGGFWIGDGCNDQAAILLDEAYESIAIYAFPAGREPVMLAPGRPMTALPGRSLAVREAEADSPPSLVVTAADGEGETYAWDGAAFV
ncbi:MAG: hypothetical protein U1E24_09020, partial [Phenylobacterium sp.]|nr:hypothetical protein [Phenylobacterium sp.]